MKVNDQIILWLANAMGIKDLDDLVANTLTSHYFKKRQTV
jgi:hypothetical protein